MTLVEGNECSDHATQNANECETSDGISDQGAEMFIVGAEVQQLAIMFLLLLPTICLQLERDYKNLTL